MTAALARQARERTASIALTDGQTRLSWQDVAAWVERAAGWLRQRGLERGDAVLGWLPNCLEWYLVRFACERAGLFWVPVPASHGARELTSIIERVRPAVVFARSLFRGHAHLAQAQAICEQIGLAPLLVEVPAQGLLELDGAPPAELEALQPHERAHALATTGSEGIPKLAVYTLAAACLRGHAQARLLGLRDDDVVLVLSPGTGPSRAAWLAAPVAGACIVAMPQFGVDAAFDLLARTRASVVCGTPSQLAILAPKLPGVDTSSIRLWYTAGSVLPPSLAEELESRTGAPVVSTYGGADFGGWAAPRCDDPPSTRRHSVGKPRGGTEFRIVDAQREDVAPGETGELIGRGPCCTSGFLGEQGARAWRDGWFHTGDLARFDAEGNIVIAGRLKDVIVRGGDKISPGEVEGLLRTHPDVAQVAVVAAADPVLGERICACVVPVAAKVPELSRLREHLQAQGLAAYKMPERLVVLESLPVVGDKVDRRALASLVAQPIS